MSATLAWSNGLRAGWLRRRDRLLADPAFRDRASRFFATRPLAQRHARELFDLMAGFVYSQALLACVELRLFDRAAAAPLTAAGLARESELDEAAAERLLEAAASLRLLQAHPVIDEEEAGAAARTSATAATAATAAPPAAQPAPRRYGLGPLGATMVGNEALSALVEHHRALYQDLADPLAMLRRGRGGGELARYWAYAGAAEPGALPAERVAPFSRVMAASQPLIAAQVLDAYPMHAHRCLLDVGGGHGAFVVAALQRTPELRAMLLDLPAVVAGAAPRLHAAGVAARVQAVGSDFQRGELPNGADIVSLVRVLYDHDDDSVLPLLRAARRALPEGGTLLVAEPMAKTAGAEAMGDAYFGLYLWAMGSGRARSAEQLGALMREAGFAQVRECRTAVPLQTRVLVARAD